MLTVAAAAARQMQQQTLTRASGPTLHVYRRPELVCLCAAILLMPVEGLVLWLHWSSSESALCADAAVLPAAAGPGALAAAALEPGALVVGAPRHAGCLRQLLLWAVDGGQQPALLHCPSRHPGSVPDRLSPQGEAAILPSGTSSCWQRNRFIAVVSAD